MSEPTLYDHERRALRRLIAGNAHQFVHKPITVIEELKANGLAAVVRTYKTKYRGQIVDSEEVAITTEGRAAIAPLNPRGGDK